MQTLLSFLGEVTSGNTSKRIHRLNRSSGHHLQERTNKLTTSIVSENSGNSSDASYIPDSSSDCENFTSTPVKSKQCRKKNPRKGNNN